MRTISTQLLKARLDRSEPLLPVMTMDEHVFRRAHIPGSIRVDGANAMSQLDDRPEYPARQAPVARNS
ncbi:MAG: hypothetical protein GY798_31420 [Hyphomicrobiales bacterium]|nr:hypothetical protein [Hyphomicrobiales bacterium]